MAVISDAFQRRGRVVMVEKCHVPLKTERLEVWSEN
jgi:hypothetical protein